MTPPAKTDRHARILHAEERAAHWLMVFNELEERGKGGTKQALNAFAKSARWLMKANDSVERAP